MKLKKKIAVRISGYLQIQRGSYRTLLLNSEATYARDRFRSK